LIWHEICQEKMPDGSGAEKFRAGPPEDFFPRTPRLFHSGARGREFPPCEFHFP
jgi:hypothetical protein